MTPYSFVACWAALVRRENDLKQNGTGSVPADLWFDRNLRHSGLKAAKIAVKGRAFH
jgi:hypothetical protein